MFHFVFQPTVPMFTPPPPKKKGGEEQFYHVSLFLQKSFCSIMYEEFRNDPIWYIKKKILPFVPIP